MRVRSPEEPQIHWRLGRSLVRLGERQEKRKDKLWYCLQAEERIRYAVERDTRSVDAHFWLGLAMGRRGQAQGILKSLFLVGPLKDEMQAVLRLDPRHGGAHHILGELYLQLPGFAGGSRKKGIAYLEKAVELDPRHTAHYLPLAEAYMDAKEKDKARELLGRLLAVKDPDDPAEYEDDLRAGRELLEKLK